jgi:two-component system sensor histidine kinase RpfC
MAGQTRDLDLLIVADSPDRQDLRALLDLFGRVLGTDVPYLLLTYGARRVDQASTCGNCLNKPFLADDLISHVRQVLGEEGPRSDAREAGEVSSQEAPARGTRVLLAEDNGIAGKVVTALLAKQGCEVTLVTDGEQALSHARAEPFAMALFDLRMPKLDGIELTRALRAGEEPGERLPIIALTANAAEDVKSKCLEAGMDDFLGKPVNPQELKVIVERYAIATEDARS